LYIAQKPATKPPEIPLRFALNVVEALLTLNGHHIAQNTAISNNLKLKGQILFVPRNNQYKETLNMKEVYGDAIKLASNYQVLCVTTNGTVKLNNHAVMGRGIAAQISNFWPETPRILGALIQMHGNHVHHFFTTDKAKVRLLSFPVKHQWFEQADPDLIIQSAKELQIYANSCPDDLILLPRPGCGNGRLSWIDVKRLLEPILCDRIHIVHWRQD